MLLVVVAARVSGVAPALFSRRSDPNKALKDGARGGSSGSGSHRLRGLLVISEIALAAVALIGAGLFARSFQNAAVIRPGFDASHVLLSRIYLPGYTAEQTLEFCRRLRERLGSGAGVAEIAYADTVPLGFGGDAGNDVQVPGYVPGPGEYMNFSRTLTAPGYFRLMRIPLLAGRDFTEADDPDALRVVIVNQTFARRFFGDASPIGRQVRIANTFMATVVGVARDIKNRSLTAPPQPYFYLPFAQRYQEGRDVAFFLRGPGDPAGMAGVLRKEAAAIEPAVTLDAIPLAQYITASLYPRKVAAVLLTALGLVALLVAAAGLYSVMTYMVNQRTQEMGIRMALGARPGDVVGAVVRQGLALACAGLLAGMALALAAARVVSSQLVDLSPGDPAAFAGALLFLGAVALLASYVPARRASRVDPMLTLRSQ
jgi:predicted permease